MKRLIIGKAVQQQIPVQDTEQFEEQYTAIVERPDPENEGQVIEVEETLTRTVTRNVEVMVTKNVVTAVEDQLTEAEEQEFIETRGAVSSVPALVTMKQARKALILSGVNIADVDAAINSISDPIERQLALTDWEYSLTVRRQSPLVQSMASQLGLTEQQVDALFVAAAQVNE